MVQAWQARQRRVEVSFDDIPEAFRNINTLEELATCGSPYPALDRRPNR